MSHRQQQKAEAREKRIAAEKAAAEQARRRRLLTLGGVGAVALAAVVAIVLLAGGGDDGGSDTEKAGGGTTTETQELFDGIVQSGTSLGDPNAKLVLTEYADLQCPFCAEYATEALPGIVDEYVRTGKLRLELRLLTFLGPDSERGANAAYVAAGENRMWQFVDGWYRNQGMENSGYGDDDFINQLATEAGFSAEKATTAARNGSQFKPIEDAQAEADLHGIESTPSFLVGERGGEGERIEVSELTFEAFEEALAPHLE